MCPSCQRDTKNSWHFLECDHTERRKLFTQLKADLNAISVQHRLHPSILTTFWLGILAIRNDTPYPQIEAELPPMLQPVFRSQTRLGWDQLYHGRVSTAWEKAINALHPESPLSGRQIMVQLIRSVWTYILSTWRLRNHHLHKNYDAMNYPDYQQAVRTMYETSSQLPTPVREAVFRRPLQDMLDLPPAVLCKWLERSSLYIKQQLKAAKIRDKLNTPDIRSFFPPQSANDLHPP